MSGTEETFHYTKEDVRKLEQEESKKHGGNVPASSETAGLQVSYKLIHTRAVSPTFLTHFIVHRRPSRKRQRPNHRGTSSQSPPSGPTTHRIRLQQLRCSYRERRSRLWWWNIRHFQRRWWLVFASGACLRSQRCASQW
jgi:hypothetical protein